MCKYEQCRICGNYSLVKYSPDRDVNTPLLGIGSLPIGPSIECEVDFCNRTNSPIDYDDFECDMYETEEQTLARLRGEVSKNPYYKVAKGILGGLFG